MVMKSFSQTTKEELYKAENSSVCCNFAQFAGMLLLGGHINQKQIRFVTENQDVLGSYVNISRHLSLEPVVKQISDDSVRYVAEITDQVQILQLLTDLNLINPTTGLIQYRIYTDMIKKECCKRAFVKGAFLGGGTVIDPRKNYNMEFVTSHYHLSRDLRVLLEEAGFLFKSVLRKSNYVLYMKSSEVISDMLTYMGAFKSQMELINVKIEKEIRNDFNRTANSETANLEKTINASVEQIKAIEKVQKMIGLDNLSDELREIALLRLEHKDLSMSELGNLLCPPLSKSGVNHRLKKLMAMVD